MARMKAFRISFLNGSMSGKINASRSFWILAAYLVLVFLIGSGSRGDLTSLVILRPVAVLVSAWAMMQLRAERITQWRGVLIFSGALFLLPMLHLIPLPPSLWQALPGREIVVTIGKATGYSNIYRPLSLSPVDTLNALCSLFVPLPVLLLGINLNTREVRLLLHVILLVGVITICLGGLQALNPGSSAFHFYRLHTMDAASGLFANRNHQALFLAALLPIIAVFAASRSYSPVRQRFIVGIGGLILLPLLLVTGSRAGLVLGVVALAAMPALMPRIRAVDTTRRLARWRRWVQDPRLLVGAAITLIAAVSVLSRRAEAFNRLFSSSMAEESRLQIWAPAVDATVDLLPLGSGIGSFVRTYQVYETLELLTPTYRNHAHNEFIEIAMTGGLPGLILLLVAIVTWARWTWKWVRPPALTTDVLYGRLGANLLLLFAIASAVDYPARVPSLACLLVIAVIWLRGRSTELGGPQLPID